MNNSELSLVTSSEDAFIASETHSYGASWDTIPDAGVQTSAPFRNEGCDSRVAELECVEEASSHRGRDTQAGVGFPSLEDSAT